MPANHELDEKTLEQMRFNPSTWTNESWQIVIDALRAARQELWLAEIRKWELKLVTASLKIAEATTEEERKKAQWHYYLVLGELEWM